MPPANNQFAVAAGNAEFADAQHHFLLLCTLSQELCKLLVLEGVLFLIPETEIGVVTPGGPGYVELVEN